MDNIIFIGMPAAGKSTVGVVAAKRLLQAVGLRREGPDLISCPTCGRCRTRDMVKIAEEVEQRLSRVEKPITVAVMGCIVNGPGEAREADVGVACGEDCGMLFLHGKPLRKVSRDRLVDELFMEIDRI